MDNYIVSARKYRPQTFDSVVGQHALTTTLKNAIAADRLAHAYLFCGPRGVGKTTCARIFAKTINCLSPGPDGEACNACESCRAFNEQRSYNIHELDAASNNSVEDIRSLIEQVQIPPQVGKYKVFIIDEVHMLSTAAFNAFLKTLEEPPAHAVFILATTEKHKILPTILSRCQIYDFNRMEVADIVGHLKYVAADAGVQYEEEALNVIAQKADGGMRDALSIFDQVASFSGGNLTYAKTIEDLNVLDYDYYFRLTDSLLTCDVPQSLLTFNEILSKGFEAGHFIGGLAAHFRDLLVSRDAVTLPLLDVAQSVRERYAEQARRCTPQFLYAALKLCNTCDLHYRTSNNKRLLVELTLIEVAQLTQDDVPDSGRGPAKKLKPLFSQTAAIAAPSAAARPTSSSPAATPAAQPSVAPPVAPAAAAPVSRPASPLVPPASEQKNLRKRPQSLSIRGLQQTADTAVEAQKVREVRTYSDKAYDRADVIRAWLTFAVQLPLEQRANSERMKNMQPQILDNDVIEVMVENDQVLKNMEALHDDLLASMRDTLDNGRITLAFRLMALQEQRRPYTRQEIFADMLKKSPALVALTKELRLELS